MELTEEMKQRVKNAVKEAQEAGWRVEPKLTRQFSCKRCCPMGALVGIENTGPSTLDDISSELGLRLYDIESFAYGFDGQSFQDRGLGDDGWFEFGREMRKELGF